MRRDERRAGRAPSGRLRGLALTTAVLAVLGLFAMRLVDVAWSSWVGVIAAGPARPDDAVAALTATAGLVLSGWLLTAVALSVVTAAAGNHSAVGQALAGITRRVAPLVLRNAVAAALGVVVATTPAVAHGAAGPAHSSEAFVAATRTSVVSLQTTPTRERTATVAAPGPNLSPAWRTTTAPVMAESAHATASRTTVHAAAENTSNTAGSSGRTEGSTAIGVVAEKQPSSSDLRPGWTPTRPQSTPGARVQARSAPVAAAPRRATAAETAVVVRRGDTLWSIAARHLGPSATDAEIALDWPRWFSTNRAVIGTDPDRLLPGERLRPPPANHNGGVR